MGISGNKKLIGGMFGLPDCKTRSSEDVKYDFFSPDSLYLANARSSITVLIDILKCSTVWMPSYLCSVMLQGVRQKGVEVRFFPIDRALNINKGQDWINRIQQNDLVILIDYFGFSSDPDIACSIKERGAWILEDASQAMLTEQRLSCADFVMVSPRKFTGVPDGGILVSQCEIHFNDIVLDEAPLNWQADSLLAAFLRRGFDKGLTRERKWFELFRKQEATIPVGYYAMGEISRFLLENIIDYCDIANRRRDNFTYLLNRLKPWAVFDELKEGVVPIGFPVITVNRDVIREGLYAENIYPPVHWDLKDTTPLCYEDSYWLSEHIMTLPCDQRYAVHDMERMASCFQRLADGAA